MLLLPVAALYAQEKVVIGESDLTLAMGVSKTKAVEKISAKGYQWEEVYDDFVHVMTPDGESVANLEFRASKLSNINLVQSISAEQSATELALHLLHAFRDAIARGIKQPDITLQQFSGKDGKQDVILIQYGKGNIAISINTQGDRLSEVTVTQQVNTTSKGY